MPRDTGDAAISMQDFFDVPHGLKVIGEFAFADSTGGLMPSNLLLMMVRRQLSDQVSGRR